jgi:hypothetical protein
MARGKFEKQPLQERWINSYMISPITGCWVWTRDVAKVGYGRICVDGVRHYTHRFAWTMAYGPIPEGMCVCHACDNKRCVNPEHLWLGTDAENMADKLKKGRQSRGESRRETMRRVARRGETHADAKLTGEQVLEIRASDATNRDLAKEFGVSTSCIYAIKARINWKHL